MYIFDTPYTQYCVDVDIVTHTSLSTRDKASSAADNLLPSITVSPSVITVPGLATATKQQHTELAHIWFILTVYSEYSLICHNSFSKSMVDNGFGGLTGYSLVLVHCIGTGKLQWI